jgi:hypothetical protein
MKHALIAAVLLSLGGVAAGCGGDDSTSSADATPSTSAPTSPADAPTDADASDLCTALTSGSSIKDGADVVDFAKGLEKVGTPSDIPDSARSGFETYVGVLEDIDPKTTASQLQKMKNPDLSKEEQSNVQAFLGYASQACAPSAPSSSAPSSPSPSDSGN